MPGLQQLVAAKALAPLIASRSQLCVAFSFRAVDYGKLYSSLGNTVDSE